MQYTHGLDIYTHSINAIKLNKCINLYSDTLTSEGNQCSAKERTSKILSNEKIIKEENKSRVCRAEFLLASCLLLDALQVYIADYSPVELMESLRLQRTSKIIKFNLSWDHNPVT